MKSRIICLGNSLLPEDASGIAVFASLQRLRLPPEVEVIEGGTAGLNLIPLLEFSGRVVFVDSVSGFTTAGEIIVLERQTLVATVIPPHFGHEVGLPYVLAMLSSVGDGALPSEILLVGLEGSCDPVTIEKAAKLSVSIAVYGLPLSESRR
jgi:hydrogenase maturation protease